MGGGSTRGQSRVRGALLAALVAVIVIAPFAYAGYRRSVSALEADLTRDLEARMTLATIAYSDESVGVPDNTWVANPDEGWSEPMTEAIWTTPPLQSITENALANDENRTEYQFAGGWSAYGRRVSGSTVVVVVVSTDERDDRMGDAARGWLLATLGMAVVAGAVGWWLTNRSLAPVEHAHMVNRDFIADAAHELRTPLSVIQASAGLALTRERSVAEYQESLTEILTAAERAGSGVGELLEFARMEAGQASLRTAPLRVDLLIEEIAVLVRADDTVVSVEPSEPVVVEADYNLIRQAIENFTRNAVARASEVSLSVTLEGHEARIDVADNGPGFAPGMIEHVFHRFRRGDRSGTAGLGMAIARTIVELHTGRCAATNRLDANGEQIGAVVSCWLPIRQG